MSSHILCRQSSSPHKIILHFFPFSSVFQLSNFTPFFHLQFNPILHFSSIKTLISDLSFYSCFLQIYFRFHNSQNYKTGRNWTFFDIFLVSCRLLSKGHWWRRKGGYWVSKVDPMHLHLAFLLPPLFHSSFFSWYFLFSSLSVVVFIFHLLLVSLPLSLSHSLSLSLSLSQLKIYISLVRSVENNFEYFCLIWLIRVFDWFCNVYVSC